MERWTLSKVSIPVTTMTAAGVYHAKRPPPDSNARSVVTHCLVTFAMVGRLGMVPAAAETYEFRQSEHILGS